jgi:hypothetical protein
VGAAATFGTERTLEVNLANTKEETVAFTLAAALRLEHVGEDGKATGAKVDAVPSVQVGTIAPQSTYPVQFRLPSSLEWGTWRGQVAASGLQGDESLGHIYLSAEVKVGCAARTGRSPRAGCPERAALPDGTDRNARTRRSRHDGSGSAARRLRG